MNSTEEGEGAVLQLQQENASLRELYGRRSREMELKMGELQSALHQANEKYKELASVMEGSQSLVSGLPGEEPEEEAGAQADLHFSNTNCAKCNELQREVKELRSILLEAGLRKEGPFEELTVQGTRGEHGSVSAETSNRHSENSEEELPRKIRPVPARASEEEEATLTDGEGMTLLHHASRKGKVRKMRELIARGADTRHRDQEGNTPLHAAMKAGKEEAVDFLAEVDRGNDIQDEYGYTPLHWAAREGHLGVVTKLLAGGAKTQVQDVNGRTPLHLALDCSREAAAELIVEVDCSNDMQDENGYTPLHLAACKGHVEVVTKLLAGGARMRVQDVNGRTPLHSALDCGKEAAAELIVEVDGSIDIQDHQGRTPLHYAAVNGFAKIVKTLLHNDVNPHIRDHSGDYPIQLALRRTGENVPQMILSSYALKHIDVDWAELNLELSNLRFCVAALAVCLAEIGLMKRTKVGAASLSCHELVTRHVSSVAPRLPNVTVPDVLGWDQWKRDFPNYADLISFRLRSAKERRASLDRCQLCFSLLPPELPPLPVMYADVVLRCLSDGDIENFNRAVQLPSQK